MMPVTSVVTVVGVVVHELVRRTTQERWVVSELELIEPGLYLDVAPGNADPFAEMVVRRLG